MDLAIEGILMSDVRISARPFSTYGPCQQHASTRRPEAFETDVSDAWMT